MRKLTRRIAVLALLGAGCADRTLQAGGEGDSAFEDDGGGELDVGAEDDPTEDASGEPARGYIRDCRPLVAVGDIDACGQTQRGTFGPARGEDIPDSVCRVCICADTCDTDSQCPLGHSTAVPSCVRVGDGDIKTCVLSCEVDTECDPGMLCLPARWGGKICQWAAEKPECCESGPGC